MSTTIDTIAKAAGITTRDLSENLDTMAALRKAPRTANGEFDRETMSAFHGTKDEAERDAIAARFVESYIASAIAEVADATGLTVDDVRSCVESELAARGASAPQDETEDGADLYVDDMEAPLPTLRQQPKRTVRAVFSRRAGFICTVEKVSPTGDEGEALRVVAEAIERGAALEPVEG